jgi:hypothetical protein
MILWQLAQTAFAMLLHPLAHRLWLFARNVLFQRRHVRRRWRRRRAEQIFQEPLAALHRRRPVRIRRHHQESTLAQYSFARVIAQSDAPEMRAINVRYSVVPRQTFVDVGVIRCQQVQHAMIVAHLTVKKQLQFSRERLPQVFVEIRECVRIGRLQRNVANPQPLAGEIVDHRFGAPIRQHAADLLLQHGGLFQLAASGEIQQLVVGNAAPQKERQARGELEIIDFVRDAGLSFRRIAFHAEQKLRADQDSSQGGLDAGIESFLRSRSPIKTE